MAWPVWTVADVMVAFRDEVFRLSAGALPSAAHVDWVQAASLVYAVRVKSK